MTRTPILIAPGSAAAARSAIAEAKASGEKIFLRSSERAGRNLKITVDHPAHIGYRQLIKLVNGGAK